MGLEGIRALGLVSSAHGQEPTSPSTLSFVPQHRCLPSPTFPSVLTSMGWEGFSTGSSTRGFLG